MPRLLVVALVAALGVIGVVTPAQAQPPALATVTLPHYGSGLVLSPDGARLFVPIDVAYNDHRIAVIDTVAHAITATYATAAAGSLLVSADRLYQYGWSPVVALDALTGAVLAQSSVNAKALAGSPDGTRLYAVDPDQKKVRVLDAAKLAVLAEVSFPEVPHAVAVDPTGTVVYVTLSAPASSMASVVALDATTLATRATGTSLGWTDCLLVSPDGTRLYMGSSTVAGAQGVMSVDAASLTELGHVDIGNSIACPALTNDGSRLYVPVRSDGTRSGAHPVVAVDTSTLDRIGQVDFDSDPLPMALTPDGTHAWLDFGEDVQLFDLAAMKPPATLPYTGLATQAAALPGVQAMSAAMNSRLKKDANVVYSLVGEEGDAHPAWTYTQAHGVTRLATSTKVTYTDGRQVCSRKVTKAAPATLAMDRAARWSCRKASKADDGGLAKVTAFAPSDFPFTQTLVKDPSVQGPAAPLLDKHATAIEYGLYLPTGLGWHPYVHAQYTSGAKAYVLDWSADNGYGYTAGNLTITTAKVPSLPRLSSLHRA